MRRVSFAWGIAALMLSLSSAVALIGAVTESYRAAGLSGLALAVIFSGLIGWRLRVEVGKVNQAIADMARDGKGADNSDASYFPETQQAIAAVSETMAMRLNLAGENRKELELVLDSMQDAVVAVDGAGRIQWSNTRMQRLMPGGAGIAGGSNAVRVGHALVQTIRDPDVMECVRRALEDGVVTVRRATSMVPGRIFEVNASPMPGGGAVAVLHDVTRIEEVERTQRDFVANVSHELRTPLTSITGYVETLLDMFPKDGEVLSEQAREFLATILKNATRMNRLTEDLLVMARVDSPVVDLNPSPVPSDELIRDAVEAMSGLVQENEAVLELGAVTDCQVYADSDAVMQVLGNLIENAIKYGRPRGGGQVRVLLSAREVYVPYDAVEFSVKDFGAGIASEHLNRIFERFYRVDKTRSRESGGTGLGLAIASHMVQQQGGAIWAESELGEGSTFLFTLPKALYPLSRG